MKPLMSLHQWSLNGLYYLAPAEGRVSTLHPLHLATVKSQRELSDYMTCQDARHSPQAVFLLGPEQRTFPTAAIPFQESAGIPSFQTLDLYPVLFF